MPTAVHTDVLRRFPLLRRRRPACPTLSERLDEIADVAAAAAHRAPHGMEDAVHALNKAALIASDCGLSDLARDLCWQHINVYRDAGRPLTAVAARSMLEPVLNLARLDIRADAGDRALHLLSAMNHAVKANTDLTVDDRVLPLADAVGTREERRELRRWMWMQYLTDGIRALALAQRWDDAAALAEEQRGIGLHLLDGRQAAIISYGLRGDTSTARTMLDASTATEPWERQVAACLRAICAEESKPSQSDVDEVISRLRDHSPAEGYGVYHARLGLTVVTIVATHHPELAGHILARVVAEAIHAGDGYSAREVLGYRELPLADADLDSLSAIAARAGLGRASLPDGLLGGLVASVQTAAKALAASTLTAG